MDLSIVVNVIRDLGIFYQLAAVVALAFALLKPTGSMGKILWVSVVLVLFSILPAVNTWERMQADAFAKEAWAYYKKLCAEKSGEKIYKTFTGVKSVIVTKPLPPATDEDNYDQYWYGDPYSGRIHSRRGLLESALLASPSSPVSADKSGRGFDFVEVLLPRKQGAPSSRVVRLSYPTEKGPFKEEPKETSDSRFAVSWEDISTPGDRKFWVAGSRLALIDLSDKSVVAERIGYLIEPGFGSKAGHRRPWNVAVGPRTTCPYSHDYSDRWFVLRVLSPAEAKADGK